MSTEKETEPFFLQLAENAKDKKGAVAKKCEIKGTKRPAEVCKFYF